MRNPERVSQSEALAILPQLVALLQDAVHGGASIGFVAPLPAEVATQYWNDVIREVGSGSRVLLIVREGPAIVGSVQLGLCTRLNGLHRAEVQKLFVHTTARRHGIGRQLMRSVEEEARREKRSLLYLDTEPHKPAETMYRRLGWSFVGEIPDFACSPDGHLHGTVLFYKRVAS